MVALPNNNDTLSIARALAAVLERLKDLAKTDPTGATGLWDGLAAHVRSASPQSMLKEQPPLTKVRVNFGERGGFVGTTLVGGRVVLFIHESTGRDAATEPLTAAEVTALASGLIAAKAATEVKRG